MKKIISQFWKTEDGTGLKDIISDIYQNAIPKISVIFNTKTGIKKVDMGWTKKDGVRGYYYILPREVSKSGQNEEVFFNTQDLLTPSITTALMALGFKDKYAVTKNGETTSVKKMFSEEKIDLNSSDDLEEVDFDNLEKKTTLAAKSYKWGTVEILHKLFKPGNVVYWPNDIKYERVEKETKKYEDNPNIKEIHMYKKLMGDTLVDNPLQRLTDMKISQTSFNVSATGIKPIVLEVKNPGTMGKYVESVQYRAKVLVQEGKPRVSYLYAELTPESFKEFREQDIIKESLYKIGKTYKVEIGDTEGNIFPLVNPKIEKMPKNEVVDLVWDISMLKVRQTVYKQKIKEISSKTRSFEEYMASDEEKFYESIGLNRKGVYEPKAIPLEEKETLWAHPANIQREIGIAIVKFPKTALTKEETELLDSLITDTKGLDSLIKQKEWLEKEFADIKLSLEEKVYKLNLIKHCFFVNGWSSKLDYVKEDGEVEFEEKVTSKGSYDGKKAVRYLENEEGSRRVKVDIKKIIKEL